MNYQITDQPIRFHLCGLSATVNNKQYAEVGVGLMNAMWTIVKQQSIATTGINHWGYLAGDRMFVGVESLATEQQTLPGSLEQCTFELKRHLRYVHIGPYQALPQTWRALTAELAARGEVIVAPSLEVYGHHCADPLQAETTILIGLESRTG